MFVRKKTKLRIAYSLLAITTASVIAYDAEMRTEAPAQTPQPTPARLRRQMAALPMTPLALSPFLAVVPVTIPAQSANAASESTSELPTKQKVLPTGVYFLKVAVQINSKDGPVSLNRGTRVNLVREQDGKLRVRRNSHVFLIEKSQATDDLNELGAIARISS